MAKKIQLSIPEPCQENWNAMTPSEKGRYCASCQKQVIDFSNMSDREIARFFKKPSTGSVCGRFMNDQLNRELELPRKRIPWVKYFFQIALPAFLFSIKARAQGTVAVAVVVPDRVVMPEIKLKSVIKKGNAPLFNELMIGKLLLTPNSSERANDIRGKVMDENNAPVSFASIVIKGSTIGVKADEDGNFSIRNPEKDGSFTLVVSSAGFEETEMAIAKGNHAGEPLIIQLKTNSIMKEVVVVSPYSTVTKGMVLGGAYSVVSTRNIFTDTLKSLFASIGRLKTYPNPVKAGTSLNIEWNQTETGNYFLQLIGQGGQLVHGRKLWIDAEAKVLSFEIPQLAAGSYFLRMTHTATGKSFTEKVVIQ